VLGFLRERVETLGLLPGMAAAPAVRLDDVAGFVRSAKGASRGEAPAAPLDAEVDVDKVARLHAAMIEAAARLRDLAPEWELVAADVRSACADTIERGAALRGALPQKAPLSKAATRAVALATTIGNSLARLSKGDAAAAKTLHGAAASLAAMFPPDAARRAGTAPRM